MIECFHNIIEWKYRDGNIINFRCTECGKMLQYVRILPHDEYMKVVNE